MIENKSVLAIITARGGSKGIPLKNIYPLVGKPLIQYTIDAALNSKYIDEVIVSTDNKKIAGISKNLGASIPFIRPAKLAGDSVSSEDVILHSLEWMEKKEKKQFELFILLQPTSPLRKSIHIDEAIELFYKRKAVALISVCNVKQHPYWMKVINKEGKLQNLMVKNKVNTRRQKLPNIFIPNGSIYISDIKAFNKCKSFITEKTIPYLMDENVSFDIDNLFDIKIVEFLMTSKK
jgi:CMP-N,N'-diacetyllegionaminic acid synthase